MYGTMQDPQAISPKSQGSNEETAIQIDGVLLLLLHHTILPKLVSLNRGTNHSVQNKCQVDRCYYVIEKN